MKGRLKHPDTPAHKLLKRRFGARAQTSVSNNGDIASGDRFIRYTRVKVLMSVDARPWDALSFIISSATDDSSQLESIRIWPPTRSRRGWLVSVAETMKFDT